MNPTNWPGGVFTSEELTMHNLDPRTVARAAGRGDLVRVKRGAYCARTVWESVTETERHRMRVLAVSHSHPGSIFSHRSAAVLLDLPIIGSWPSEVHVSAVRASGGRSEVGVRRHCRGIESHDWHEINGIRVTTVERTLIDLALVQQFRFAVAPVDHSLKQKDTTREKLRAYLDELGTFRGLARVIRVFEFADARGMSPGESLSRATIHELGFPRPILQVEHRENGRSEFTDFEWPTFGVIGEFDGRGKYLKEEYLRGQTTAQAVIAEKDREDRLRLATGSTFGRWGWEDALRVAPLRDILLQCGLPSTLPRSRAHAADRRVR